MSFLHVALSKLQLILTSRFMNNNLSLKLDLQNFKSELCHDFLNHRDIVRITNKLVAYIDELLILLFHTHQLDTEHQVCLIALGSYGRRELQLYSDIDLLILHTPTLSKSQQEKIELFVQDCWDIGLDIGHQLTTVNACAELASQDLSVISNLMDIRVLCGSRLLVDDLLYQIQPLHMWTSHDFFYAKVQEQNTRYTKYNETAYNLEPNIKYGPGGLRDIQIILTLGKRHFGIKKLAEGITHGFLTDKEYEELSHCQHYLMSVRFALHQLAQKNESRLLFDYQIKLAVLFGFKDTQESLAIEQFMKAYFKVIKRTRELNEMLLQWFSETHAQMGNHVISPLDSHFQLFNHYIEVRHANVFSDNPHALLDLFLWIARRPDIRGVRAATIRLIRQNLYLITDQFRSSKAATTTFMTILKTENSPYPAIQLMSQYGVLGHYLDCFASVTGQMQYDLFHVYTVDQHTLFVIRNMVRFKDKAFTPQFPIAAQVMSNLPCPEILYLSGLFHDIAKGRGGDHSELGATEAAEFGKKHHLSQYNQQLLVWLVRNHLLMSTITQRQDIYDPKTIQHFCNLLPDSTYLDCLYLLTIADICATNPALWTAWKDSLLKELYLSTKEALHREKKLDDEISLINKRREQALTILQQDQIKLEDVETLWQNFKGNYFLHESPEIIARHTKAILECTSFPLILIMPHHSLGGTEVFIYMPHCDKRFTITTTVLNNQHATIQEANIMTCGNQYDLDTYIILDDQNRAFFDPQHTKAIHDALQKALKNSSQLPSILKRRLSRAQAHFSIKPDVTFNEDKERHYTHLLLVSSDRPGLLAEVSQLFLSENIHLHNAKISTVGERVEDLFYITNHQGLILDVSEQERLSNKLMELSRHKSPKE